MFNFQKIIFVAGSAWCMQNIMTVLLTCSLLFLFIYILLLGYYYIGWKQAREFTPDQFIKHPSTSVTIIIPARNEGKNLPSLLSSLLAQHYPPELMEVLVIDDHSTDDTAAMLEAIKDQRIKLIPLIKYVDGNINSYKKKAIEVGIAESRGKLIVTTDADCIVPPDWLLAICSYYELYSPAFIAAPVAFNCSNRFIEIFQALDFMSLQGITGAAVQKNIHSMCNGANMAYERSAFFAVGGFEGIDALASGDDMLLMHKISKAFPKRIAFLKSTAAIVQTTPQSTISGFFNQRARWASKSFNYDDKTLLPVLAIVYLLNLCLLILPIAAAFCCAQISLYGFHASLFELWLMLLLLKTVAELVFLFPVARFFDKRSLLWVFPLMQPFHILYTVIAGFMGKFGSFSWKERSVK